MRRFVKLDLAKGTCEVGEVLLEVSGGLDDSVCNYSVPVFF